MSYLREYIRHCLFDTGIYAYGEYPLTYSPESVLLECNALKEDFDIIHENMDLAYFSKNQEDVNGAAWVKDDGKIFEFAVVTDEKAPEFIFENLVQECMEEYTIARSVNPALKLEVKVEDDETENYLRESFGLISLRNEQNMLIMGYPQ